MVMLVLALMTSSCTSNNTDTPVNHWVIGILPDQHKDKILSVYQPLIDYLSGETGATFEIRVPDSYQELLAWFGRKEINLALFGGVTFVKAHQQFNAVPLVKRDIDGNYSHYILVRTGIVAGDLKSLKGLKFAFGSPLSTSGNIMPRYYFQESGIDPDTHFSEIHYSGAHDKTALMIQNGTVDAGAVNSGVARKMYETGELDKQRVRILWRSLPYQDYVFAVQHDISNAARHGLIEAFLKLHPADDKHREILQQLGANYYLPSLAEEFNLVRSVVSRDD